MVAEPKTLMVEGFANMTLASVDDLLKQETGNGIEYWYGAQTESDFELIVKQGWIRKHGHFVRCLAIAGKKVI